jgi:hypothetical protein
LGEADEGADEEREGRKRRERKTKNYAEGTESTEFTEKKRRAEVFDRKSPPFPPEAGEGWGTLKFWCGAASEPKPKTQTHAPCLGHPGECATIPPLRGPTRQKAARRKNRAALVGMTNLEKAPSLTEFASFAAKIADQRKGQKQDA